MWTAEVPCLFRFVLVGEIQRDFVGVFNKTIIPLALVGYEMIIANSALRASIISYPTRPRGIIVKYIFFFSWCWRFENINFAARCRTINSCTDWKWIAENINKCVKRMAVRGGLSPPPGPMNQIHYCHSIVKHTSLDSINKLIIQLKNESLSRSLL